MKISVVINTYNAEKYLKEVLESAKDFDEIVICDMESTDKTKEIAEKYNCRIAIFKRNGYTIAEPARTFAIQQAAYPWVLMVDADEVISEALRKYLYDYIQKPNCDSGIYIPRKNFFMNTFLHGGYPDRQLRFFKRDGTVWPPHVHSMPIVQGTVYKIPAKYKDLALIHLANDSITTFVKKTNEYTDNELEKKKHKNYGILALLYRPLIRFFKVYVLKGGFKDGVPGFINACLLSHYQFIMVAKIIERRRSTDRVKTY